MKIIIRLLMLFILIFGIVGTPSALTDDTHSSDLVLYQDETNTEDDDDDETNTEDEDDDDEDEEKDDEKDEDEEKKEKEAYEREVQIEADDEKLKIESKLKNGNTKDKLKIEFEVTGEEPEIELKYENEVKTDGSEIEISLKYKVKFLSVIEYVDNGTVGNGYQAGEEVFVYRLDKVDWGPLVRTLETHGLESVDVFTASTVDGVFTIIMKISSNLIQLENATLTPNSLKIDIGLSNFPYTTTGSSLAVETKIKSESKTEVETETEEEGTGFATDESQVQIGTSSLGFFSWAEFAVADEVVVDVHASTLTDTSGEEEDGELEVNEKSGRMYFSFIVTDAVDILWDPKMGVVSEGSLAVLSALNLPAADDGSLPFSAFWILSVALIGLVRLRKFKK